MIHYKTNPQLDFAAVLDLYDSVSWSNYTNRPQQLEQAFHQSLFVMAAYDDEELVGLIRAVGDGLTIVFIQDLLVYPHYQRQGIGRSLLQEPLERFKDVYQIQLATEQSDKNLAFYQELGFRRQEDFDCTGMIYAPDKK
ncbi:GNAT family N-acetyltransferase [Streptococcus sanguinis]|uniref:GNAT family N-acetyltransferase n=1 Tax=Streptococcus sanguinis TaxID=1305 RepID=UPI000F6740C9|nr:GNAT family N-acetyltransferase [Streptococcus sanguinis]MCY7016811.1 GNAT family N-acetyltransferase [Streptococcus sanguinis]RSI52067.1 putative acetyltransferase [Streptococcus sanguinis]